MTRFIIKSSYRFTDKSPTAFMQLLILKKARLEAERLYWKLASLQNRASEAGSTSWWLIEHSTFETPITRFYWLAVSAVHSGAAFKG